VQVVRGPGRDDHTRAGRWLMTHDRGAPAVIGGSATLVLIADLAYTASPWNGSFARSFLITLGGAIVCFITAWLLRLSRPIGADRRAARRRQRGSNAVLISLFIALVVVSYVLGGDAPGQFLGVLAGAAGVFAVMTLVAWRRSPSRLRGNVAAH
jgi:hypothetical protein